MNDNLTFLGVGIIIGSLITFGSAMFLVATMRRNIKAAKASKKESA